MWYAMRCTGNSENCSSGGGEIVRFVHLVHGTHIVSGDLIGEDDSDIYVTSANYDENKSIPGEWCEWLEALDSYDSVLERFEELAIQLNAIGAKI